MAILSRRVGRPGRCHGVAAAGPDARTFFAFFLATMARLGAHLGLRALGGLGGLARPSLPTLLRSPAQPAAWRVLSSSSAPPGRSGAASAGSPSQQPQSATSSHDDAPDERAEAAHDDDDAPDAGAVSESDSGRHYPRMPRPPGSVPDRYAIMELGGTQYKVVSDDLITVEKMVGFNVGSPTHRRTPRTR